MSPVPNGPDALLHALRSAATSLGDGASVKEVRSDLEPLLAKLWPWSPTAEPASPADLRSIAQLLTSNEPLSGALAGLMLDLQILHDALHREDGPNGADPGDA